MRRIHGSKVSGTARVLSSSEKICLTPLIFCQSSTVDGDVCLLTDSPYRILRVSNILFIILSLDTSIILYMNFTINIMNSQNINLNLNIGF